MSIEVSSYWRLEKLSLFKATISRIQESFQAKTQNGQGERVNCTVLPMNCEAAPGARFRGDALRIEPN